MIFLTGYGWIALFVLLIMLLVLCTGCRPNPEDIPMLR
jgi:hypothetical protein